MHKEHKVSIYAGVIIGLVCLSFLLIGWVEPHWTLRFQQTDVKDVLNLVLASHTRWTTVQGKANVIWYGENGDTQSYTTEFVFQQPGHVNVKLTEAPSFVEQTSWISDGENVYEINLQQGTYSQSSFPVFALDTEMLPNDLSETSSEFLYLHPLALLTPSPVAEFIFPHGFAQGNEGTEYELIGEEKIAGRDTWIMSMTITSNSVTAWIDKETGVILKYIHEINDKLFEDFEISSIQFSENISENTFVLPENLTRVESNLNQ